jgi:hypothetical protein
VAPFSLALDVILAVALALADDVPVTVATDDAVTVLDSNDEIIISVKGDGCMV